MAEVNLKNTLIKFFAVVLGLWFLFLLITVTFKTNIVGGMIIIPLLAAVFSGRSFVKAHKRAPNDEEAKALTRVSFFYFVGFHLLLFIVTLTRVNSYGLLPEINAAVLTQIVIFLAFYFGISFFFIRWGYGGLTQKLADTP